MAPAMICIGRPTASMEVVGNAESLGPNRRAGRTSVHRKFLEAQIFNTPFSRCQLAKSSAICMKLKPVWDKGNAALSARD